MRDKIAEEFMPVFTAKNDGVAVRITKDQLMRLPKGVSLDYDLYCLVELLDMETGSMDVSEPRKVEFEFNVGEVHPDDKAQIELFKKYEKDLKSGKKSPEVVSFPQGSKK